MSEESEIFGECVDAGVLSGQLEIYEIADRLRRSSTAISGSPTMGTTPAPSFAQALGDKLL